MSAFDLLSRLRSLGVRVHAEGDRLRIRAPEGTLTDQLKSEIGAEKEQILALLARAENSQSERRRPPLVRTKRDAVSLPSFGQERLWRLYSRAPTSAALNLPLAFRLRGLLDREALEHGFEDLVRRHAILRATFPVLEGEPRLRIGSQHNFEVAFTDLESQRGPVGASITDLLREEARRPFDLEAGPLLRVRLIRLGPEHHVLTLVMHHIISDGWSFDILLGELGSAYGARKRGHELSLPSLEVDYRDFVEWQRAWLSGDKLDALRTYWKGRFSGEVQSLKIPGSASGRRGEPAGARVTRILSRDLTRKLESVAAKSNASLFMIMLTGYLVVLRGRSGQQDLVVCTAAAGRGAPQLQGLIGYFNNLLALRVFLEDDLSFLEGLGRVRATVLEAFDNQDLPFQEVASFPNVRRTPLTRAMFGFQDHELRALELAGLEVSPIKLDSGSADFDLGLTLAPCADGSEVTLTFRSGVMSTTVAEGFLRDFQAALETVADRPDTPISDLVAPTGTGDSEAPKTEREEAETPQWLRHPDERSLGAPTSDPLEVQMTLIWERVLDLSGIGPDEDFFDLGGHSLLAVELLDRIESELGVALPLAIFFDASTVAGLRRVLRDEGWKALAEPLVTLQPLGTRTPVFVLHSFEGHVFFFNDLAQALAPDRPVYGLQAAGVDTRSPASRSVEELAESYLPHIRAVQATGPYVIIGMCFGAMLGLELARRLEQDDEEVELVFLDGGLKRLAPKGAAKTRLPKGVGPLSRVVDWYWAMRMQLLIRTRAWRAFGYLRSTGFARREMKMRSVLWSAWCGYRPQPISRHLTLVRSAESVADRDLDWQLDVLEQLASGRSTTLVVPGGHFTILRRPVVGSLVSQLERHVFPSGGLSEFDVSD